MACYSPGIAWSQKVRPGLPVRPGQAILVLLILSPVSLARSAGPQAYTMGRGKALCVLSGANALTALVARPYVQMRVYTHVWHGHLWSPYVLFSLRSSTEGFCSSFLG